MHADQLAVSADTVRRLIRTQFPQWAELPVRELPAAGTVNAIFRIGEGLAARLPLRRQDVAQVRESLRAEAAAARELAAATTVPTPEPVAIGDPGEDYPLPWSVHTWLPGRVAALADPASSVEFAHDLAGLITELRATDTKGRRFTGEGRGGHLPDHDAWLEVCFTRSEGRLDVARLRRLWAELRTLPEIDADVMSHGDLTPTNVLVCDGRLAGILDTGGFAAADPALDLMAAWHLLDAGPREALRQDLSCTELQWRRGMAWALEQAMGLVWYYAESNPAMSRWGRRTLDRLVAAADR